MAGTLTKITRNFQVTIPPATRRALKLRVGDFVEATPHRQGVLLRPAKVVTEEAFEQEISRRLQEGLADVKAGRVSRPFSTVNELVAHLDRSATAPPPRKRTRRR